MDIIEHEIEEEDGKMIKVTEFVFKTECPFCRHGTHESEHRCPICHHSDYLNATIKTKITQNHPNGKNGRKGEIGEETGEMAIEEHSAPCHLLCALMSPQYKLTNFEKFEFEKIPGSDSITMVSNCQICGKEVVEGITCNSTKTNRAVHLRCALKDKTEKLRKNRKKILEEVIATDQAYPGHKSFWSISLGLFKLSGHRPTTIKLTEIDLFDNYIFAKIAKNNCFGAQQRSLTRSILQELNYSKDGLPKDWRAKKDLSIKFTAHAPGKHKESVASYCLCGVNEEKIETNKDNEKHIESIQCEVCGVWYHDYCVKRHKAAPTNPNKNPTAMDIEENSETEKNDFYKCPKCDSLQLMWSDLGELSRKQKQDRLSGEAEMKHRGVKSKNFLIERALHILKRDNIKFHDYLICLDSLGRQLDVVDYSYIRYWQNELPFSIQYLQKRKYKEQFVEQVVIKHYCNKTKQLFRELVDKHSRGLRRFEEVNFRDLDAEHRDLRYRLFKPFEHLESDLGRPLLVEKFLELIKKIGNRFQDLKNKKVDFKDLWKLFTEMNTAGLLEKNNMGSLLKNAMVEAAQLLDSVTEKLKIFRLKMNEMDVFQLSKKDLSKLPTLSSVQADKGSLMEAILKTIRRQNKGKIKKLGNCKNHQDLINSYKEGLRSLFFTDLKGLSHLQLYSEYHKRLTDWHNLHEIYHQKMKSMQNLASVEALFDKPCPEQWLLRVEEARNLLKIDSDLIRFIPPEKLRRIELSIKNSLEMAPDFSSVYQNFIKIGKPLNPKNLHIVRMESLKQKILQEDPETVLDEQEGKLKALTEREIEELHSHLSPKPNPTQAEQKALKICQSLKSSMEKIKQNGYPSFLPKATKYTEIQDSYREFKRFRIKGKCWEKLERAIKPITWVDELKNTLILKNIVKDPNLSREAFVENFESKYLHRMEAETLKEFCMLENFAKEGKNDTGCFKLFPDLKLMQKSLSMHYHHKVMSEFKSSDHISVRTMLRLVNIRFLLELNSAEDGLFEMRCKKLKQFVKDAADLASAPAVELYDFKQTVENLNKRRKKFKDFIPSDKSVIMGCVRWLSQAIVLKKIFSLIKEFSERKLGAKSLEMYKKVYEFVRSDNYAKLNIMASEKHFPELGRFKAVMEDVSDRCAQYEGIKMKIDKALFDIDKKVKKLSLRKIGELDVLPDVKEAEEFLEGVRADAREGLFQQEMAYLKDQIRRTRNLKKHLDESISSSKTRFNIFKADMTVSFTFENLKTFEIYIKNFLEQRAKNLRLINQEVIDKLRVVFLVRYIARLYLPPPDGSKKTLNDLEDGIDKFKRELMKLTKFEDRQVFDELRALEMLELEHGKLVDLKNKFYNDVEVIDVDEFFEVLKSIKSSRFSIFMTRSAPGMAGKGFGSYGRQLDRYFQIMDVLRAAYESRAQNLQDMLSKDDLIEVSQHVFPKKLKKWTLEQFSKGSFLQHWASVLAQEEGRVNGLEVDLLLDDASVGQFSNLASFRKIKERSQKSLEIYTEAEMRVNDEFSAPRTPRKRAGTPKKGQKVERKNSEELVKKLDLSGQELSDIMERAPYQYFNKELRLLGGYFLKYHQKISKSLKTEKTAKIDVSCLQDAMTVFDLIESRISNAPEPFKILQLGKSVKEEVKEEMAIKAESGEILAAYSSFLELIKPPALEIYRIACLVKNIAFSVIPKIIELNKPTDGTSHSNDSPETADVSVDRIRAILEAEIDSQDQHSDTLKKLDFGRLVQDIDEFLRAGQEGDVILLNCGSEYLDQGGKIEAKFEDYGDDLEGSGGEGRLQRRLGELSEYLDEQKSEILRKLKIRANQKIDATNLQSAILKEKELINRGRGGSGIPRIGLKNYKNLKARKMLKSGIFSTKQKTGPLGALTHSQSHLLGRSIKHKGHSALKKRRNKKFNFYEETLSKVKNILKEGLPSINYEDAKKISERITAELTKTPPATQRQSNTKKYSLDQFADAVAQLTTQISREGEKEFVSKLITDIDEGNLIGARSSLISRFINLDMRELAKKKMLSKREPKQRPAQLAAPPTQLEVDLRSIKLYIKKKNNQLEILPKSKYFTRMPGRKLKELSLRADDLSVELSHIPEMPIWVNHLIAESGEGSHSFRQEHLLYGVMEVIGGLPGGSVGSKFLASSSNQLGHCQVFISAGVYLPEKFIEKLGYSKKRNLESIFYLFDFFEVNHKKVKLRFKSKAVVGGAVGPGGVFGDVGERRRRGKGKGRGTPRRKRRKGETRKVVVNNNDDDDEY